MFRDAKLYYDTNDRTKVGCHKLLDCTLPKMSFQEDDTVLDIGCGPGDNTRNIIRARIPKLKKLVAIDIQPEMIEFAKAHFSDEKIEHHVADIEDRFSLKPWQGSISKAFSVYCFFLLKDQRNAFRNLYDLLKPNGEAALLSLLSVSIWDYFPDVINCEKWNKYLKDADQCVPDSHRLHLGAGHYRKLLEDLGFEVLLCKEEDGSFLFSDDVVLKTIFKSFLSLPYYIPEEMRGEFIDEFFNLFLKSNKRNSDGQLTMNHRSLTIHIRKH